MIGTLIPGTQAPGQPFAPAFISGAGTTPRFVSDTLVNPGDAIVSGRSRTTNDTLCTVSDSIIAAKSKSISDTLATVSDSTARTSIHPRAATDTACTMTDSLSKSVPRTVNDTLLTVTDSLSRSSLNRGLTDTAVTPGDSISRTASFSRALSDTAQSPGDTLAVNGITARFITDTLASVTDTVGVVKPRFISDTLLTLTDSIAQHRVRALTDTAATMSDTVRRLIPRFITDTLVTFSELILSNDNYVNRTPIFGTAGTIFGTNQQSTVEVGEFRPGNSANYKHTVWYDWLCPVDGKYRFQVEAHIPTNAPFPDPVSELFVAVYEYDPGAPLPVLAQLIMWNDDATVADAAAEDHSAVNFIAEAGTHYIIQVGSWESTGQTRTSPFDLVWFEITGPTADDFPGRTLANGEIVNGNPEFATAEPGDPWYWIRDLSYPFNVNGAWIEGQYGPSNRTLIYKFTPDISGPVTIQFYEATEEPFTGESVFWLFDGDGVTSVDELVEANAIAHLDGIFDGEWTYNLIAGRDYYLWVTSDDGAFGPDGRHILRVRWTGTAAPPNDNVIDALDLDDEIWHDNQSTENATWEKLSGDSVGNELDNIPPTVPEPATVWYKLSFPLHADEDTVVVHTRLMSADLIVEEWVPERINENELVTIDTLVTMSDSLSIIPLKHYVLSDTLATMSDSVARTKSAARTTSDIGANLIDLGIASSTNKPGSKTLVDVLVQGPHTSSLERRVTRRLTDSMYLFVGTAGFSSLTKGPTHRGRPLSDTLCTMSDSVAKINLRHYVLSDTLASMGSSSVVRAPIVRQRPLNSVLANVSDEIGETAAPYWDDLFSSLPPDWNTERSIFGLGDINDVTYAFVSDPLAEKGTVARFRCAYDSGKSTSYASADKQLVSFWKGASQAHSGYLTTNEETWYLAEVMFPSGGGWSDGETNFLMEWHTDDDTQSQGGNSPGIMMFGGFPLTSDGTTTPKLTFRHAAGTPSSPTYEYYPTSGDPEDQNDIDGVDWNYDQWYTWKVRVIWSTNPTVGRVEWYVDDVLVFAKTMATLYVNTNLPGNHAYMTFGMYVYRYNVTVDTTMYIARCAAGPTEASIS